MEIIKFEWQDLKERLTFTFQSTTIPLSEQKELEQSMLQVVRQILLLANILPIIGMFVRFGVQLDAINIINVSWMFVRLILMLGSFFIDKKEVVYPVLILDYVFIGFQVCFIHYQN